VFFFCIASANLLLHKFRWAVTRYRIKCSLIECTSFRICCVRVRPRPSILGWLRSRSIAAAVVCHSGSRAFSQNQRLRSNIFLSLLCALSVRRQFVLCLCVWRQLANRAGQAHLSDLSHSPTLFSHTQHLCCAAHLYEALLCVCEQRQLFWSSPNTTIRVVGKKNAPAFLIQQNHIVWGANQFSAPPLSHQTASRWTLFVKVSARLR